MVILVFWHQNTNEWNSPFLVSVGKMYANQMCAVQRGPVIHVFVCLFSVIKKIKATEKLLLINAALLLSLNNFEDSKRLCCWVRGFVEDIDHGLVAEQRSVVLSNENVTICCRVLILLKATVNVKILLISFLWQLAVSYDGRMIRALIVILYFYFSLFYTIYILIYRILFIWYQFT